MHVVLQKKTLPQAYFSPTCDKNETINVNIKIVEN